MQAANSCLKWWISPKNRLILTWLNGIIKYLEKISYFGMRKVLVFMQFWIHLALVVVGIAYFLYSYIKERRLYQLLLVIWIPLTLFTYVSKNRIYLIILGIVQLIFFILVIYFLFRRPGSRKKGYQDMLEQLDSYGAQDAPQSEADGSAAEESGGQAPEEANDDQKPEV